MRVLKLILCGLVIIAAPALAADEFGSMFSSNTPDALQDPSQGGDDELQNLLNLEPAAGDEAPAEESAVEGSKTMLTEDPAVEILQDEAPSASIETEPQTETTIPAE